MLSNDSTQSTTLHHAPPVHDETGQEFLAFTMGDEEYGLDILKVQEIRGYEAVTRIANAPNFFKGVMNLRGVIVLNLSGKVIGMVVDRVSDVTTLTAAQIRPAPDMGGEVGSDYLIGLGTLDERMLILVDIDKLMSTPDMAALNG